MRRFETVTDWYENGDDGQTDESEETSRIEEFSRKKTEAKQQSMSQDTTTTDGEQETKVKTKRDDWDEIHKLIRNVVFALLGTALFALWMVQYDTLPKTAQNFTPIIAVALLGAAGVTGLGGMFRK